jgi:hypothetical protein
MFYKTFILGKGSHELLYKSSVTIQTLPYSELLKQGDSDALVACVANLLVTIHAATRANGESYTCPSSTAGSRARMWSTGCHTTCSALLCRVQKELV